MNTVMYVLNTDKYSGAENVVIQIIKNLRESNYRGIYVSRYGLIEEYLKNDNIFFFPVSKLNITNLKTAIRQIKPDIIHANDFRATVLLSLCNGKIPLISHIHNNEPWIRKINLKSVAFAISTLSCRKILTVSQSVSHEYVFKKFIEKKCLTIGNPIDSGYIRSRSYGNIKDKYDVVILGRLSPQKNPLYAIEIIDGVNKIIPIKCVFVGDGELKFACEKKIRELKLEGVIRLAGFQKNPYKYLAASKIMLMPSLWEGFGLAAVEALVFGKPVVCSNVGGLPSFINESCGKVCCSTEDYIKEVLSLLCDTSYYKNKSNGALKKAKEMDNIQQYMNQLTDLYKSLLGSS